MDSIILRKSKMTCNMILFFTSRVKKLKRKHLALTAASLLANIPFIRIESRLLRHPGGQHPNKRNPLTLNQIDGCRLSVHDDTWGRTERERRCAALATTV